MKTIDISTKKSSINELLNMAKEKSVLVKTKDGDAYSPLPILFLPLPFGERVW
jgi:hypothetical protein